MHRQTRSPLKAKENRSGCAELKEEASFPPSKGKICRETKSKVIRAPKKENSSDGKPGKRALKCPKGLEGQLSHPEGDPGGWDVGTGSCKESFPSPLGSDLYLTPERHREEGKTALGTTEEWGKTPVDFAAVTIADFGITQESFATGWKGSSLALLKWRRRSTVGLHGSPESNSLIQYLTQQRRNRSRAPLPQISPFKHANVRSLKDKIEAFQTSFESLQEAEGETEQPGLSHGEGGSSQNKTFKKEQNLEQSEKFLLDNRGADLKENLSAKVTKCDLGVSDTEHAAPKEWVYEAQNPPEPLETLGLGDILGTAHVSRPAPTPADPGSDALSDPGRRKVGFVGELSLGMLEDSKALVTPPVTPGRTNILFQDLSESGSLRSILKKTPRKQLLEDPEECSNDAVARGGGESVPDFNCAKIFEAPQTDNTESLTFKTPKKKKVTFGEDLSPEIFDQTLPANTPLHRGASPALQSCSPARPPPLPQLHLHWDQECLEPLQDFLEDSVAAEELPPVGNAEETEPDLLKTRSSTKRKHRALAEEEDCGSSGAEDTKNPRKTKTPRQRNVTASAPKKTPKTRRTGCGKRRKKKVKKSLYEERELASKKPLLSPIPEIPEVFSSASSPNSPGADAPFSEDAVPADPKSRNACKDVQEKALLEGMGGKNICAVDVYPRSASGPDQKFSNVVPDTKGNFVTSEYFQQGEETAGEKEAKESGGSLIENKQLEGNVLIRLEFLDEGPQRVQCPQKDSGSGSPVRKRRRSSSAIYFPPVENLGVTGMDLPVLSYNVEEVLSVPRGPFQPLRRKSSTSGERRVRRSMRFSKEAGREGLAWIQLPSEIPEQPPKSRRRASTSILTGAGNAPPREQNLSPSSAPGKENEDSAGPCRRWRRRSLCAATPGETPEAQTHKRRSTNPANGKDRHKQTHSQEAKMPLERTFSEVSALSDFLK